MGQSLYEVQQFAELFAGNRSNYGETVITGTSSTGKVETKCRMVHNTVTTVLYEKHILGQVSIGIAPIMEDGVCYFGAIDIDNYSYDLTNIVKAIYDFDMPIAPFYSKSKKLHLYVFFTEPAEPAKVKDLLQQYAIMFACSKSTEIFPKQSAKSATNTYSWINLPYFDANDESNPRKLLNRDMTLVPFILAIPRLTEMRMTIGEHQEFIKSLPFNDAPPCIRQGAILRDIGPGQRNNWLFSASVYFRLKDENSDIVEQVSQLNASLFEPLPESELKSTILQSLNKKTYFYKCAEMERCDKAACKQVDYGIESKFSTGLEYGQMTQYDTDPPYYTWIVNGQTLTFYNEAELIQQTAFRNLCLRLLHIVPRKIPEDRWASILTKAAQNMKIVQGSQTGDFTTGSTLNNLIREYFSFRRVAETEESVKLGRTYYDKEKKVFLFDAQSLLSYIRRNHDFKVFSPTELQVRVQAMGAFRRDDGLWILAEDQIPGGVEHIDYGKVDMNDKEYADDAF